MVSCSAIHSILVFICASVFWSELFKKFYLEPRLSELTTNLFLFEKFDYEIHDAISWRNRYPVISKSIKQKTGRNLGT